MEGTLVGAIELIITRSVEKLNVAETFVERQDSTATSCVATTDAACLHATHEDETQDDDTHALLAILMHGLL